MPTFTAVALDRLLDPGSSKSAATSAPRVPPTSLDRGDAKSGTTRTGGVPQQQPMKLGRRRNSTPAAETERRPPQLPHISPALYSTPVTLPLPDSPGSDPRSAFLDSPYIVNHKRRGPRLVKSVSEQNVASKAEKSGERSVVVVVVGDGRLCDAQVVNDGVSSRDVEVGDECSDSKGSDCDDGAVELKENGLRGEENCVIGGHCGGFEAVGGERVEGGGGEVEDFFDAWEELSSDSGRQNQRSFHDIEAEMREMRLSLLMEIEKRKQAEEALNNMRNQWQMLRGKMRDIGLVLPPDSFPEVGKTDIDVVEEISRQFYYTRLVSECIGSEVAKAEAEAEREAQLEKKNFEIARLNDRLHYYETINREMSQRNQEAIERARHDRQMRKRRLRWVWGSVGVAVAVSSIALAWSYGGKASSLSAHLEAADRDTSSGH